jgi:hypothetical protein
VLAQRTVLCMAQPGSPVDAHTMARWAELALSIRAATWVIQQVSTPDKETAFSAVDHLYPSEAVSQWCREGLRSALDHLNVWADKAVPLQQFDGQVVVHSGFRWPFTLIRAGIEGAAQSLWLSSSTDSHEALARLVRMVRHDLSEQERAWTAMGRDTALIAERRAKHEEVAKTLAKFGKDTPTLPNMVDMVKSSAKSANLDPLLYEAHWRTCSAAAHGKDWATRELQTVSGDLREWMPGQFHFQGHIDAAKLTSMLSDTVDLVAFAEVQYVQRSYTGDIGKLLQRAAYEAAKATPQKDDGTRLAEIARQLGINED